MNQSLHSRSLFLALLIASVIGASVEAQMQQEDATVAPNGPEELMVFDEVTNEDKLRAHITPKDEDCKFVPGTSDIIAVTGSDMLTWQNVTDTESVQDFDTVGVEPDENVAVRFKGEMGCPGGGGGGVDNPPEWKVLVGDVKISPVDYVLCGQTIAVGLRVAPDDLPAKAVVTVSIETTAQGGAAMFIVNGQEQTTVTLSSGQSSVQLKGTKASAVVDDVILKAKVAGKTVSTEKLHVIGVKEVYWETYAPDTPPQGWTANTPIDDHPAIPANGGKRIFPDKTSPSDSFSAQRKKVYLKAKLTPAIAGINVFSACGTWTIRHRAARRWTATTRAAPRRATTIGPAARAARISPSPRRPSATTRLPA